MRGMGGGADGAALLHEQSHHTAAAASKFRHERAGGRVAQLHRHLLQWPSTVVSSGWRGHTGRRGRSGSDDQSLLNDDGVFDCVRAHVARLGAPLLRVVTPPASGSGRSPRTVWSTLSTAPHCVVPVHRARQTNSSSMGTNIVTEDCTNHVHSSTYASAHSSRAGTDGRTKRMLLFRGTTSKQSE